MKELLYMILPSGRYIFKAILMVFFVSVTFVFFRENGKKAWDKLANLFKEPCLALFLVCVAYMSACTIMGRYYTKPYSNMLGRFGFVTGDGKLNSDGFANIIMFIPYTFLYIMAFKPKLPWKSSLILSVSTTVIIECSQLIGWLGSFQISDLVHNVIGGMIGCGIWSMWKEKFISKIVRWSAGKQAKK